MDNIELLNYVDHTILDPTATWEQVEEVCNQALKYQTASVCVPPRYVKKAARLLQKKVKVCTVVGFPLGYSTPETKIFETEDSIRNGADEIDVVMNIALAKSGDWEGVLTELKEVKRSCGGRILKVIIETSQLTQEEKISACRAVSISGADFIKTSTGFQGGGATIEDIALFQAHGGPDLRIKASGGISTLAQGKSFIEAGAHRLGSSKLVALVEASEA